MNMVPLGIVWRLAAILMAALAVIQFSAIAIYYSGRDSLSLERFRAPFLEQVVVLARLLDEQPEGDQRLALQLANASGVHAVIEFQAPPLPEDALRLPQLEELIASKLPPREPASVLAWLRSNEELSAEGGAYVPPILKGQLSVSVPLADGRHLVVKTVGELTVRLMGLPVGFVIGVLGALVALLAVLAVFREMRPLSRLASSVGTFGGVLQPVNVEESGAREVRTLIRAINQMQARIASLVKSRTFVLAAISHDLRTYLTRLRLRMEFVEDGELREKSIRDVGEMQAIVEEALAFAKASLTPAPGEPEDVVAAVRRVSETLSELGGRVTFHAAPGPHPVRASPATISRIARNLIENAVVHGGSAEVSVMGTGEEVELWCEDRGPGIPPAQREAIFEPFHRLESSRSREHGGVGLGLTIVRQLVEGLGGHISVEDRPGGGSRFRVRLPRYEGAR